MKRAKLNLTGTNMVIRAKSDFFSVVIKGWHALPLFLGIIFYVCFSGCKSNERNREITDGINEKHDVDEAMGKNDFDTSKADDDNSFFKYKECLQKKYYNKFAGYQYAFVLSEMIDADYFKIPVNIDLSSINEKVSEKGFWQVAFSGKIPYSEEYIEEQNPKEKEMRFEFVLYDYGFLRKKNEFIGKKVKFVEKVDYYTNMNGEMSFIKTATYRMEDGSLIISDLRRYGDVIFKPSNIDLSELLPEFEIKQDAANGYEICKMLVDNSQSESYYDFLCYPDLTVKCNKDGKTIKMKEGLEYFFCGFQFFITESVAVAKGIDDDGSVDISGLSSYFTMYIVSEDIFQK